MVMPVKPAAVTGTITTSTTLPAVLASSGSILAQSVGGQQILHVIHTIPSHVAGKMGQLQTIPLVVQSLPVVYTAVPADGVPTAATAITVPLIGTDGRSEGSGEENAFSVFFFFSPLTVVLFRVVYNSCGVGYLIVFRYYAEN